MILFDFTPKAAAIQHIFLLFLSTSIWVSSASSVTWSHRVAGPVRFHLLPGEHPMLSHGRRLYLHPRIAGQTTSGRLALLLQRIVVEPSPVRGLAADDPLSPAFRLAPCAICALFSAFATVTLESVSFLCCGAHSFRDFQQFSLFPCGRFPTRCTAITCPWRALLPLRFRAGLR